MIIAVRGDIGLLEYLRKSTMVSALSPGNRPIIHRIIGVPPDTPIRRREVYPLGIGDHEPAVTAPVEAEHLTGDRGTMTVVRSPGGSQ